MNTPSESPLISHGSEEITRGTVAKIAALLLATGIGISTIAYGVKKGFNTEPRAPHSKGIKLSDKEANKKIMCLRELFYEQIKTHFFKNRWMAENCDTKKMRELSTPPNQLRNIVEERKTVLQDEGLDPATETWLKDKGNMRIHVDTTYRDMGISAGKIKK